MIEYNLRVLGSPNPGQSFGHGVLAGTQATGVTVPGVGTWAAKHVNKNIKIRIGIWILALSGAVAFWRRAAACSC